MRWDEKNFVIAMNGIYLILMNGSLVKNKIVVQLAMNFSYYVIE